MRRCEQKSMTPSSTALKYRLFIAMAFLAQWQSCFAETTSNRCDAEKARKFIGQNYSAQLAEKARALAGAALAKREEVGKPYTMETNSGRLILTVDKKGVVIAAWCA